MKKSIFLLCILMSVCFAKIDETKVFFNENQAQINPTCVDIFVNLVKTSSYDFKFWDSENKGIKWLKNHISFMFDAFDEEKIIAKLFFNYNSKEFQGTGTITWLKFDIKNKILRDLIQEKDLKINANLANKLETCMKFCDFKQTLILQEQYKNENINFLMQNKIAGKDKVYFYSAPNENCKIDDLFLTYKDKFNLLLTKDDLSFMAYKRKNGELIKLWIKSKRIKF